YAEAEELFDREKPDFVDIVTGVDSHRALVLQAAERRIPVICQKPMAPSLAEAAEMVRACEDAQVPFFVHENWRWQAPVRALKAELGAGRIGTPFRARLTFSSSFPVFDNQPFLKTLDRFILTDVGSHVLDVARFLFGEAETLTCVTRRVRNDIRGEDVATVLLRMAGGIAVTVELSYASRLRGERFPETFVTVEGSAGSLEVARDCVLHATTAAGTFTRRCPPPRFAWADPAYDLVHASIAPCNADLLGALRGERGAETTGADNFQTVRLVFAAYHSATTGETVNLARFHPED
ncbi:MAG TPA: Gfo/Idh/MocA family oxidoreductase, partial [Candidatus Limnocylindria bacterium]|nr:Gfo/Idh/MocA family oxidoreductase [Candidatus Limnocylindria bacterium]